MYLLDIHLHTKIYTVICFFFIADSALLTAVEDTFVGGDISIILQNLDSPSLPIICDAYVERTLKSQVLPSVLLLSFIFILVEKLVP